MESDQNPDHVEQRRTRRNLRRAIAFGVVMATIEMAALLYFMYC